MSAEDQLPTVADSSAIAVRIAGELQADAAAFAGKLAVTAPDRGREPALPQTDSRQLEVIGQAIESVWNELQAAAAMTPEQIEYGRPVFAQYAELFEQARQAGDPAERKRLARNLGLDLIIAGALTVPQLERMRPILARFNPRAAEILRSWPVPHQPASGSDVNEMRELNRLIANPSSRYWRGPDAERLQARLRELLDRGVRSDAIAPTAPDQVDSRITELTKLMRNTSSEYHRGPNAAALQQEYRDLVDQRERLRAVAR